MRSFQPWRPRWALVAATFVVGLLVVPPTGAAAGDPAVVFGGELGKKCVSTVGDRIRTDKVVP